MLLISGPERLSLRPNPSTNLASGRRGVFMRKGNILATSVIATILVTMFIGGSVSASAATLKKGMTGSEVTSLQKDLISLGYLNTGATGFYGDATVAAVKKLQSKYDYSSDGVAGDATQKLISGLSNDSGSGTAKSSTKVQAASNVQSTSGALKIGDSSQAVTNLQSNLKALGFLTTAATGYFGSATEAAVMKLQKKYGYNPDGIAGSKTLALVNKLAAGGKSAIVVKTSSTATASASKKQSSYLLPWFSKVSSIFAIGKVATVYDINTGLSFKVKRTYGHNHADCETLTAKDTAIMKKIFGGSWSWDRRAVIVTVGDTKIAASLDGMPHAGLDDYSANVTVSSRSGGFGRGENLDTVKGNNMNGHFDIHFYGSRTHGTNSTDPQHQKMVKTAAQWANTHY